MLEAILLSTRTRIAVLESRRAEIEAAASGANPPRDFLGALSAPQLGVITEVKRRSPSVGSIAPDLDPTDLATAYSAGGAVAISVLTEPVHFGGSMDDLRSVIEATSLPVLCKDFILDPLQVSEARAGGADAVLLITSLLSDALFGDLLRKARDLGMAGLVETHDAEEVRRAVDLGAEVVGVNNRDLDTFEVDLGTAERLRHLIPPGVVAVAESGVASPQDADRMRLAGFDAVLVGQAAAAAADPARFVASLRQVDAPTEPDGAEGGGETQ